DNSIFSMISFDFDFNVMSYKYNNFGNYAAGWCSIFCNGMFDLQCDGHFILQKFGIVVEFLPGSIIFISFTCIIYGDTAISKNEAY
ncbi:uncharacterized protein PHACADRAFT_109332, partial [Phanerochaete carnosa HHB-10118-sp]